ncbi:hypothetical protein ACFFJY_14070 [Fictibacillus aquaticus]|uniref:Uncharacterized protein n=1 Tax=Fictibacillus aquaticus TaxID=2021314 RepID=A0A235FEZ7_9BACL|nr:hypothetical protein [Fictibacillus aquaticus]OYD59345.1 hypothetical protein CGZ90_05495 [Fictibacillus aquaticus]
MSLASYVGCNVKINFSDQKPDNLIYFGPCFADDDHLENVKKHQFSTPFVYEVSSSWGIELTEHVYKPTLKESKEKLLELCRIMDGYLAKGDCFELYSCWIEDECDPREGKLTLPISGFDVDQLKLPAKTLVRFEK